MRLKFTRVLWIPESGIWTFKDISWKPTHSGCDHLCRSSSCLTSIYSWYQPHSFMVLSTSGPVFLTGWLTACCFARLFEGMEGGGGVGFLSLWTSEGTRGSYLHFLSLCRGTLPGMADLINASVIYLPPLKLLSCCWSESCTVTPLWAAPASKLPSTVILSCRAWRQGKRCFDLEDVYISSWESWPQMSLNLTNFHFTIFFVSRPKLMKALVTNP